MQKHINECEMERRKRLTLKERIKAQQVKEALSFCVRVRGRRLLRTCAASYELSDNYLGKSHVNYK